MMTKSTITILIVAAIIVTINMCSCQTLHSSRHYNFIFSSDTGMCSFLIFEKETQYDQATYDKKTIDVLLSPGAIIADHPFDEDSFTADFFVITSAGERFHLSDVEKREKIFVQSWYGTNVNIVMYYYKESMDTDRACFAEFDALIDKYNH